MREYKILHLQSKDIKRVNFDAFIQSWCLSASNCTVTFKPPRCTYTKMHLREKMKVLKPETHDLLLKTFITNGYWHRGMNGLLNLSHYLPDFTPTQLDFLWECQLYSVLESYYLGSLSRDKVITPVEQEHFNQRIVKLHLKVEPTKEFPAELTTDVTMPVQDSAVYTLRKLYENYVINAKTPEQFEFLFSFKIPSVTTTLLRNMNCPQSIMAACQDDSQYAKALLANPVLPDEIILNLIIRHKVPITSYGIERRLMHTALTSKIVVDVRHATEEDVKNGITLEQKQNWWDNK